MIESCNHNAKDNLCGDCARENKYEAMELELDKLKDLLIRVTKNRDFYLNHYSVTKASSDKLRACLKEIVTEYNNGPPYSQFDWYSWKQKAEEALK